MMDLIFHCIWLRNMILWHYSIIYIYIYWNFITTTYWNNSTKKGLNSSSVSLVFITKAVYWLGFYFEGGDQKLYFFASYRLRCVKWDSSESERQRSETEGDGWREGGVDRVRSDFGNQPKVTLFIQSCQRCGDAPDCNNNTAIRPASAKHTPTLLDSDPLYLLIRRTFIWYLHVSILWDYCPHRFSFPDFFGLGKPPRIIQCWVWVGRCFSQHKWFPVALSCIIRSADNGLTLTVRLCGHDLWKPRSASVTGSANGNEAPPSDIIQIALFMPHAWMNPGLFTEDTTGSCNSSQQHSLQDRIILLTIRHPMIYCKHLLLVISPFLLIFYWS